MSVAASQQMAVLRTRAAMQEWRTQVRMARPDRKIGFVPTMGALHDGHGALLQRAASECDEVVLSIFVNPAQFGPKDDFSRYPRSEKADLELARQCGASVVFAPQVLDVYPNGFATRLGLLGSFSGSWEGAARPGHFDGVCLVVAILLNLVAPDVLYLGQKDYQQVVVLQRMVADLGFRTLLQIVPTVREDDGLAMSSRNRYLNEESRVWARAMPRAMTALAQAYLFGERRIAQLEAVFRDAVSRWLVGVQAPAICELEYLAFFDAWSLQERALGDTLDVPGVAAAVLRVAQDARSHQVVRLLDNLCLSEEMPWLGQLQVLQKLQHLGGHSLSKDSQT